MYRGMAIMMMITIVNIAVSSFTVVWTHDELIFPDRMGPKFVFDMFRAFITLGFAVFWM